MTDKIFISVNLYIVVPIKTEYDFNYSDKNYEWILRLQQLNHTTISYVLFFCEIVLYKEIQTYHKYYEVKNIHSRFLKCKICKVDMFIQGQPQNKDIKCKKQIDTFFIFHAY
jgi:hypothetical protein